jgi:hypothetical protein
MEVEVSRLDGVKMVPEGGSIGVELFRVVRFRNYRLFPKAERLSAPDAAVMSHITKSPVAPGIQNVAEALLHGGLLLWEDGRYLLARLEIVTPSGGTTHELLRSIPLGRVITEVIRETHPAVVRVDRDGRKVMTHPTEELTIDEQIVALFHIARAAGENVNTVIADALKIKPAAAAQRVARLRKRTPPLLPLAAKQGARR